MSAMSRAILPEAAQQSLSQDSYVRGLRRIVPRVFAAKLIFLGAAEIALCMAILASAGAKRALWELLLGFMMAHQTELVHQCLHKTALGSTRWDSIFGRLLAWPTGVSFWSYLWFHHWHHKHNGSDVDQESFGYAYEIMNSRRRLNRLAGFARHVSMVGHYRAWLRSVALASAGRLAKQLRRENPEMNPEMSRKIEREYVSQAVLGLAVVALTSVTLGWRGVLNLWFFPLVLVWAPVHALVELPEHWYCERGTRNVIQNTRSIRAGAFARWFTNGNCYHVGHHFDPRVAIERLPEFEAYLRGKLGSFDHEEQSYFRFYASFLGRLWSGTPAIPEAENGRS
jgi:fatty acid desaturase